MSNINQNHSDRSRDADDFILWTASGVALGMQASDITSGPMVVGSSNGEPSSFDVKLISQTLGMDTEDMTSGATPLQSALETQDTTQEQASAEDRLCPLDAEMTNGQFSERFEIEIEDTYGIFQPVGAVHTASKYTAIAADLTRLYDIDSLELPPPKQGRGYMTGFGLLSAQRYFPTTVRILHFGIPEITIQAVAMTEVRPAWFSERHIYIVIGSSLRKMLLKARDAVPRPSLPPLQQAESAHRLISTHPRVVRETANGSGPLISQSALRPPSRVAAGVSSGSRTGPQRTTPGRRSRYRYEKRQRSIDTPFEQLGRSSIHRAISDPNYSTSTRFTPTFPQQHGSQLLASRSRAKLQSPPHLVLPSDIGSMSDKFPAIPDAGAIIAQSSTIEESIILNRLASDAHDLDDDQE